MIKHYWIKVLALAFNDEVKANREVWTVKAKAENGLSAKA